MFKFTFNEQCRDSEFRRNKSAGAILSYDALPESLKKECLVRSKTDHEDEDELKER